MAKDYYEILGIAKNATPEEVKAAFRRLAHVHHPDKKGGNTDRFKEINEAYQVLSDAQKRAQYDQYGSTFEQAQARGGPSGFEGFGGGWQSAGVNYENIGDIFGNLGDIFGMGSSRRARASRGQDIETTVTLSFRDSVFGSTVELPVKRQRHCIVCKGSGAKDASSVKECLQCHGTGQSAKTSRTIFGTFQTMGECETCHGKGKIVQTPCVECRGSGVTTQSSTLSIVVPSGVDNGSTLRLQGEGEAAPSSSHPGDLYVHLRVGSDKRFTRSGQFDLLTTLSVSITQASLGAVKEIPTVDGAVTLTVPSGVQHGQRLRIKNHGIVRDGRGSRGDLYVEINIQVPLKLNRQARELLEQLDPLL